MGSAATCQPERRQRAYPWSESSAGASPFRQGSSRTQPENVRNELARQLNISSNKAINNLLAIPNAAPMGTHADKNNPYKWRLLDEAPITSTEITQGLQTLESYNPQNAIEPGSFGYIDQSAEVNCGESKHNEDKHKDHHKMEDKQQQDNSQRWRKLLPRQNQPKLRQASQVNLALIQMLYSNLGSVLRSMLSRSFRHRM